MRQTNFTKFFNVFSIPWRFFYFVFFVWIFILLPCGIEAGDLARGQKSLENDLCFLVGDFDVLTTFAEPFKKRAGIFFNVEDLIYERSPESGRGFVKLFFFSPIITKDVGNKSTEERANEAEKETEDNFTIHDYCSILLGYIAGCLAFCIGFALYKYYTQR